MSKLFCILEGGMEGGRVEQGGQDHGDGACCNVKQGCQGGPHGESSI